MSDGADPRHWGTPHTIPAVPTKPHEAEPTRRVDAVPTSIDNERRAIAPGNIPGSTPKAVNHPAHYGGGDNPYEVIKVIAAWGLGFCLGNVVKYVARAGKKNPAKEIEDLEKARFYLDWHIARLKAQLK